MHVFDAGRRSPSRQCSAGRDCSLAMQRLADLPLAVALGDQQGTLKDEELR